MEKSIKNDQDKPRLDLVPPDALLEIAKAFTYGANKYSAHNWETTGFKFSRLYSALNRHLNAFWSGENIDKESQLLHLAAAGSNILMLLSHVLRNIGVDDRPNIKVNDGYEKPSRIVEEVDNEMYYIMRDYKDDEFVYTIINPNTKGDPKQYTHITKYPLVKKDLHNIIRQKVKEDSNTTNTNTPINIIEEVDKLFYFIRRRFKDNKFEYTIENANGDNNINFVYTSSCVLSKDEVVNLIREKIVKKKSKDNNSNNTNKKNLKDTETLFFFDFQDVYTGKHFNIRVDLTIDEQENKEGIKLPVYIYKYFVDNEKVSPIFIKKSFSKDDDLIEPFLKGWESVFFNFKNNGGNITNDEL